ncbi:MAG: hypothetical protein JXA78_00185 [Anaerolineales bacterium]|nr:hypothetical protein [Anaerolineales bacterium]
MSGKLQITTFGGLSIQLDGQPLSDFASRKVESLLVYLACTGGMLLLVFLAGIPLAL